jgi:membrane-bound serine protease (ClpP class)
MGSRALRRKPVTGLPAMIGSRGKVVSPLAPKGVIRIKGELWEAKSAGRRISTGEVVTVVGQDGLRLIVRKSNAGDSDGTE